MKREALGHTKMKRLCRKLNLPLWQATGILEVLWHTTARQSPRGDIGKLSNEDIALSLDYRGDEDELIAALIHCGWLDETSDEHRILVHDWPEHADDSVHMRMARAHQFMLRSVRTEGESVRTVCVAPKWGRLSQPERGAVSEWYSVNEPHDHVRMDSPSVRTAGSQNADLWEKPEPLPLPEPDPEPDPEPSRAVGSSPYSDPVAESAERMYKIHPKKVGLAYVLGALRMAVKGATNRADRLIEIESCHSAWVLTPNWRKENGKFAPKLSDWLANQGFLDWPNGKSKSQPTPRVDPSKIIPWNPELFKDVR